jgi:sugar phosphate isomerase/epimerase
MFINFNPNTIRLGRLEFEAQVDLARRHGFGGIDLPLDRLQDVAEARRLRDAVDRAGLRWGLADAPLQLDWDEQRWAAGLRRLEQVAPRLREAGCTRFYNHIWPGSRTLAYQANWSRHVDRLRAAGQVCAEHRLVFGIEFIGPKTLRDSFEHPFIHTLDEAIELIRAAGRAGLGIVVDLFHFWCSGDRIETLGERLADLPVVNVHAMDARADRTRDEQMDLERSMPLETGQIDAAGILRALASVGYAGPVICEPFKPAVERFASMDPEAVAAEVYGAMHALFRRAGLTPAGPKGP